MKPSVWNVPEPTTVSPGGSAAAALLVVPADAATVSAVTATATTRRARARVNRACIGQLLSGGDCLDDAERLRSRSRPLGPGSSHPVRVDRIDPRSSTARPGSAAEWLVSIRLSSYLGNEVTRLRA